MNFCTIKIRGQYKVVPHETQVIFTGTTVFKKLSTVFPPIPRYWFFLLDFNMLYPRLNRDDILTENIVLNSTGSSLFFIDPDIPEVNSYKSMFSTCKVPVKILPPSSRQANEVEILRTARRVTIDELTFLDPNLYKFFVFLFVLCILHPLHASVGFHSFVSNCSFIGPPLNSQKDTADCTQPAGSSTEPLPRVRETTRCRLTQSCINLHLVRRAAEI
ncbi:uncharacterized protein [Malus domestica]|uniref:uncharacterized protein n=1 Tax=Malus domestica TaxID=3750 RepID=UPI00397599F5